VKKPGTERQIIPDLTHGESENPKLTATKCRTVEAVEGRK
jgi:hypothetical protein